MSIRERLDLASMVGDVDIACDFKTCDHAARNAVHLYQCCPGRPAVFLTCQHCLYERLVEDSLLRCQYGCGFQGRARDWVIRWEPINLPAR